MATAAQTTSPRKLKVATTSLAGCFGCHMSLLDIDERVIDLAKVVEFDRSPINDIKHCGPCDIGIIEGAVCNAENVHVLREFRANCKVLIACGACAVNGGLPAMRNHLDVGEILKYVYGDARREGLPLPTIPNCRCCSTRCGRSTRSSASIISSPAVRRRATRSGSI